MAATRFWTMSLAWSPLHALSARCLLLAGTGTAEIKQQLIEGRQRWLGFFPLPLPFPLPRQKRAVHLRPLHTIGRLGSCNSKQTRLCPVLSPGEAGLRCNS